jgi:hypothetical protein
MRKAHRIVMTIASLYPYLMPIFPQAKALAKIELLRMRLNGQSLLITISDIPYTGASMHIMLHRHSDETDTIVM